MILPFDSEIPAAKLADYLLLSREESDKSRWLARCGYYLGNWLRLADDIRSQILTRPAMPTRPSKFGGGFGICGQLVGPSGVSLRVRTI